MLTKKSYWNLGAWRSREEYRRAKLWNGNIRNIVEKSFPKSELLLRDIYIKFTSSDLKEHGESAQYKL